MIYLTVFALLISVVCCDLQVGLQNVTMAHLKSRQKRGLIFGGGGVNKMLYTLVVPVELGDPVPWRGLLAVYNLQCQYGVPTSPLYWWDKFGEERSLQSVREEFDRTGQYEKDESRMFAYIALEKYMDRQGKNGRKCLLRAICENAQIDEPLGIFAEILHVALNPGQEDLHDDYHDAFAAGKSGVDCFDMFPECPRGDCFIDKVATDYFQ